MDELPEQNQEIIEKRKKKILNFLKKFSKGKDFLENPFVSIGAIIFTIILGVYIRIQNLPHLANKYLLGLDPYFFFRYAQTLFEKGTLPVIDYMRYSPVGYPTAKFSVLTHLFVYSYKIANLFYPMTQKQWHIIYPPVITAISFVFFFLMLAKLFNKKTAIIGTALLATIPAYIYRTGAGFADHEAFAMLFMFAAMYFFVLAFKSLKAKKIIIFSIMSTISASLMAASWGGVKFLTVSLAIFLFTLSFLSTLSKKQIISSSIFILLFIPLSSLTTTLSIKISALTSIDNLILLAALGFVIITQFVKQTKNPKIKEYLSKTKLPNSINGTIIYIIFSIPVLLISIITGIFNPQTIIENLFGVGLSRFQTTVSESMVPQIKASWMSSSAFGTITFLLIFISAVFLIYCIFKNSKRNAVVFSSITSIFFLIFIGSNYSGDFQRKAIGYFLAHSYMYLLILLFAGAAVYYVYIYKKSKSNFEKFSQIKWQNIFILSFFLVSLLVAKGSTRLLFALAPFAMIVIAFFFSKLIEKSLANKKIIWISFVVGILFIIIIISNSKASYILNSYAGSGYPGQWESSMTFLRENTSEDSVIAHWWDYGYWTQTEGKRTTVGDGGNLMGWNHQLGRYAMTGKNETEYLAYLKTHKVTHLLYSEEEIGKYHAFSFIGSDENLDRESTIGIFSLRDVKEVRNGTRYIYQSAWGLDKDYVIGNTVFEQGADALLGLSYDLRNNKTENPLAYLYRNGQQYSFPAECVCYDSKCRHYESKENSFPGCFVIAPFFSQENVNERGTAFYLSPKVNGGLFAELYIKNQKLPYFNEVYNDKTPLGLYNGRLIGPIRIWEVSYPSWVKEEPNKYIKRSVYG